MNDADLWFGIGLGLTTIVLAAVTAVLGRRLLSSWRGFPGDDGFYELVAPTSPTTFVNWELLWHMSMDSGPRRRGYLLSEEDRQLLTKANFQMTREGQPVQKIFDFTDMQVPDGERTSTGTQNTLVDHEDGKKRLLRNQPTRTARTEDVEERWRRKKKLEKEKDGGSPKKKKKAGSGSPSRTGG